MTHHHDADEAPRGGTDWRRFAMIFLPALLLALILAACVLTGIIPSFGHVP